MKLVIFCLIQMVMGLNAGERVIKIISRSNPNMILSTKHSEAEGDSVLLIDFKKNKGAKKASESNFTITSEKHEITQGKINLCKDEFNNNIKACVISEGPHANSKWNLFSENGGVKIKNDHNLCMMPDPSQLRPEGMAIVANKCLPESIDQIFDISDVKSEDSQDSDGTEENVDHKGDAPMGSMLEYILSLSPQIRSQLKSRLILYDGEGKKIKSFAGSVESLTNIDPSLGLFPHMIHGSVPYQSPKSLDQYKSNRYIAISPTYSHNGSYA
ncbi:hypothetical protein HK407_09g15470 [Ordospora pajunii]|uniref:uncharacterized protein n=1 Tax=Ordospora pajunii TaxID=3039483 RepID=UPI0029527A2E|nr:uncharacterized protein HK407_09g15470 [Ordospora pajunii]KAH9410861.1 hypothetical protein HK407_09g15470 [Ordospora pajunii]